MNCVWLLRSKTVTTELTLVCRRKILFEEVIFVKITEKFFYDKFVERLIRNTKMTNVGVKTGHGEVNIQISVKNSMNVFTKSNLRKDLALISVDSSKLNTYSPRTRS